MNELTALLQQNLPPDVMAEAERLLQQLIGRGDSLAADYGMKIETRQAAAVRLHVSTNTVDRLCDAGVLRRVNLSERRRGIASASVDAHLAKGRETAA
jgi:hypothetical protein